MGHAVPHRPPVYAVARTEPQQGRCGSLPSALGSELGLKGKACEIGAVQVSIGEPGDRALHTRDLSSGQTVPTNRATGESRAHVNTGLSRSPSCEEQRWAPICRSTLMSFLGSLI